MSSLTRRLNRVRPKKVVPIIPIVRENQNIEPSKILDLITLMVKDITNSRLEILQQEILEETKKAREAIEAKIPETIAKIEAQIPSLRSFAEEKIQQHISSRAIEIRGEDGKTPKKGVDYFDGAPGKTPTEIELKKLINSFVPPPRKGDKGDKGADGSPDTPDQIINKINKASGKIKLTAIAGLVEQFETFKKAIMLKRGEGGRGGMGNFVYKEFTGNGVTTTFTLDYNVASGGKAIMLLYNGQPQEYATHYTVSGKTITTTFTPEDGLVLWAWYIRS